MHGGCEGSVACCLPASALTSKQARTRIGAQPATTSSAPVVFALAERGCIVRLGGSAGRPGRRRANAWVDATSRFDFFFAGSTYTRRAPGPALLSVVGVH